MQSHKIHLSDADCMQAQQTDVTFDFHEDP